ncbi:MULTISPECIES: hypothetical protein [Aquitalea]|nr:MULTISPECIES: hypothetical protein [Aquitalea]
MVSVCLHRLVDRAGIKMMGEGEWKAELTRLTIQFEERMPQT